MCFPTTSVSIQIIIHWHHHALKPNLHKYLIVTIYIVAAASQRHPRIPSSPTGNNLQPLLPSVTLATNR